MNYGEMPSRGFFFFFNIYQVEGGFRLKAQNQGYAKVHRAHDKESIFSCKKFRAKQAVD